MFLETWLFQMSGLPWAGGKQRNGEKNSDFKRKAATSAALPKLLDGLSVTNKVNNVQLGSSDELLLFSLLGQAEDGVKKNSKIRQQCT